MKRALAMWVLLAWVPAAHAQSADSLFKDNFEPFLAPLNDTGVFWCANNEVGRLTCPQSGFPDQDGDHGRDALARLGLLNKIGGGAAGFDYTKITNSGLPVPPDFALGPDPNNWGCTRDNATRLLWEVKVDNPGLLRHMGHRYTWYSTDASVNGGVPGSLGTAATCNGTLAQCNTQAYVAAVNAQGMCGFNDWRLPTLQELQGIIHYGVHTTRATLDALYFVNTVPPNGSLYTWTGSTSAYGIATVGDAAWYVSFESSAISIWDGGPKDADLHVRLVRGGQ